MNNKEKHPVVYLNNRYLLQDEATISVMDRGFLLGDAIYEVIPVFGGVPFRLDQHLDRLDSSLSAIRLHNPLSRDEWYTVIDKITSNYEGMDQSLYIQVTRGIAPNRDHVFPDEITPTVLVMTKAVQPEQFSHLRTGIAAVTMDDIRWQLCRIKATTLLANVLARQQALDANALEAILIRNGLALEGAASNLFVVRDGVLITPPKGDELLPGITRDLILELAAANDIPYEEKSIPLDELKQADEIWLSSSVREIVAVIELDQQPVGDGKPGPLWSRMHELYEQYKQTLRPGVSAAQ